MNLDTLDNDVCKEILQVLAYLDNFSIPDSIFNELVKKASTSKREVILKKNLSLLDQELSPECLDFLALIYYQNASSNDKEEILKRWENNEIIDKN